MIREQMWGFCQLLRGTFWNRTLETGEIAIEWDQLRPEPHLLLDLNKPLPWLVTHSRVLGTQGLTPIQKHHLAIPGRSRYFSFPVFSHPTAWFHLHSFSNDLLGHYFRYLWGRHEEKVLVCTCVVWYYVDQRLNKPISVSWVRSEVYMTGCHAPIWQTRSESCSRDLEFLVVFAFVCWLDFFGYIDQFNTPGSCSSNNSQRQHDQLAIAKDPPLLYIYSNCVHVVSGI